MRFATTQELRKELRHAHRQGLKFVVYESIWRGHPFITEISGVKKTRTGLAGFSYQCCELKQPQMRRIVDALYREKLRFSIRK